MRSTNNPVERGRRSVAFFLLALGTVVLGMSAPRIGAGFARMPGSEALAYVQSGYMLSEDGFERIVRSRERALAWGDDPESYKELGLVYLAMAQTLRADGTGFEGEDEPVFLDESDLPTAEDRTYGRARERSPEVEAILRDVDDLLGSDRRTFSDADRETGIDLARQGIALLTEGLTAAPADPIYWAFLGLAYAEVDDPDGVARALAGSHAVGPISPEVAFLRSRLALAYWDTLEERARERAKRDFVLAMQREPEEFVQVARVTGRLLEAREALELALDAKLLERFELLTAGPASTS